MRYFTSDWHLASNNIIKYAHRPFKNAVDAEMKIVDQAKNTMTSSGLLFHVGDFALTSIDRHGNEDDVPAFDVNIDFLRHELSSMGIGLVLMKGNHDDGRNGEADIDSMVVDLSQKYRHVRVAHYPTTNGNYKHALCGHVHNAWLVKQFNGITNINVGVDVWGYCPVKETSLVALLEDIDYIIEHGGHKCMPTCKGLHDVAELKKLAEKKVAMERNERKAERYKRKGLTPEECERRKQAALAAKKAR